MSCGLQSAKCLQSVCILPFLEAPKKGKMQPKLKRYSQCCKRTGTDSDWDVYVMEILYSFGFGFFCQAGASYLSHEPSWPCAFWYFKQCSFFWWKLTLQEIQNKKSCCLPLSWSHSLCLPVAVVTPAGCGASRWRNKSSNATQWYECIF